MNHLPFTVPLGAFKLCKKFQKEPAGTSRCISDKAFLEALGNPSGLALLVPEEKVEARG